MGTCRCALPSSFSVSATLPRRPRLHLPHHVPLAPSSPLSVLSPGSGVAASACCACQVAYLSRTACAAPPSSGASLASCRSMASSVASTAASRWAPLLSAPAATTTGPRQQDSCTPPQTMTSSGPRNRPASWQAGRHRGNVVNQQHKRGAPPIQRKLCTHHQPAQSILLTSDPLLL
jgi:hypothetical protein